MFKSLTFKKQDSDNSIDHLIIPPFVLKDTVFTCEGKPPDKTPATVAREIFLFFEYQKRNLAVTKNLALLYLSYTNNRGIYDQRVISWIDQDAITIDYHFPELQYGIKYAPCVKYQAHQLRLRRKYGARY